jgi:hypothetical protein
MTTSVEFLFPDQIILPSITMSTIILGMLDWIENGLRKHHRIL